MILAFLQSLCANGIFGLMPAAISSEFSNKLDLYLNEDEPATLKSALFSNGYCFLN